MCFLYFTHPIHPIDNYLKLLLIKIIQTMLSKLLNKLRFILITPISKGSEVQLTTLGEKGSHVE